MVSVLRKVFWAALAEGAKLVINEVGIYQLHAKPNIQNAYR